MKEFEIALLSASFLGIKAERLKQIQVENIVNFSLLVNLGLKIKELNNGRAIERLILDYKAESSNPKVFGPLQKMGFNWYFGANSGLNPYSYSKDFPLFHKIGYVLNRYEVPKKSDSGFKFKPLKGGPELWDNLIKN